MRISGKHISNNNQSAVKILAKACRRYSRGRNRILAGTAALGIIVLCSVFSIAFGKIEADYLMDVRSYGTVAASYLERGTMEQYQALQELDYVEYVGRQVDAGSIYQGEQLISSLQILDSVAWEKMQVPAYTHIHGKYPQKEGELMLPVRALEALQILQPEEGMELTLSVKLETGQEEEADFTLCGWYTDYVNPVLPPDGYTSEAQAQKWGMSLEEPDYLLICQKNSVDGYSIEDRLYADIPVRDRTQRFLGGNTYLYTVVNDLVGGYGMAAFCAALVLIGVFFLIYNIFGISIQKEIRQIGLLDTLGTTRRQICGIYLRQTAFTIFQGVLLGTAGAAVVILFLVPGVLGNLYLYNYGKSADLLVFRPGLFGVSVIFTAAVVFGAAAFTIYRAARLTPLEALHYTGVSETKVGRRHRGVRRQGEHGVVREGGMQDMSPGGSSSDAFRRHAHLSFQKPVLYMAWQNLFRYRKRCFLTILSLFLGIVTALGAVVLSKGTDVTHSIEKYADFRIGGNILGQSSQEMIEQSDPEEGIMLNTQRDEFTPITLETKERLLSVQGITKEDMIIVKGAYMHMDILAESMEPWVEAVRKPKKETDSLDEEPGPPDSWGEATIQIVDEDCIRELEEYVERNELHVDMKSLRDGTGAVFLHYHAFSPTMQEEADKKGGLPITFWRLPTGEERTVSWERMDEDGFENWRQENCQITQMKMAGYLDTQAKGFPKFRRESNGFRPYFLVSEKGFQKLETKEKIFSMDLNVDQDYEPAAKAAIRKILQDENHRDVCLGLYVFCKSDDLASAQEYIRTNRIILGALSMVLILMGLLNYLNVIATGILSRQKELAVMECVGMTGRQIKWMLAVEGGIYCVIVGGLVLTAGSGILQMLRMYMENKIAYFRFLYPGTTMGGILAVIFAVCVSVPLVMYGQMEKRSVTQRIAKE